MPSFLHRILYNVLVGGELTRVQLGRSLHQWQ